MSSRFLLKSGAVGKPHLPDPGVETVIFLKLTPMVRLGMQVATPLYPPLSGG